MMGERIKEIRKELKLRQVDFADLLNTTQNNVAKYENGYTEPNIKMMIKIAKLGSRSLDWLLTGEDIANERNGKASSIFPVNKILFKRVIETVLKFARKNRIDIDPEQLPTILFSLHDLVIVSGEKELEEDLVTGVIRLVASGKNLGEDDEKSRGEL